MSDNECMNHGDNKCDGVVEYRYALSSSGKSFKRCDFHWDAALTFAEGVANRYPVHAPSDFDPAYAGESWGDDY